MNTGDIGHVERCLVSWIPLFKGTGKHKYATHLENFLRSMHFELPEATRHAVRYNWLPNITGKPGKFWAVDWYVELHNLHMKVRTDTQIHNKLTGYRLITAHKVQTERSSASLLNLHSSETTNQLTRSLSETFSCQIRRACMEKQI